MRRFVTTALFVLFAIPFGISIDGCHHAEAPTYCNGQTSGVQLGQLASLDLEPRLTGISLNEGEIGRVNSPAGRDCRGDAASAASPTYASTNIYLADVQPSTGALCAGSWNRNTGGGIPDYTVCTPSPVAGVAYVTASSQGVVSNPVPVFIHPVVTSIVLGSASTNCTTDAASNCVDLSQLSGFDSGNPGSLTITRTSLSGGTATYTYPAATAEAPQVGQTVTVTGTTNGGGILNVTKGVVAGVTTGTPGTFTITGFSTATTLAAASETGNAAFVLPIAVYNGNSCLSQGQTAQLVARTYGTVAPTINITGYSLSNNVVTFQTAGQSLSAGQTITLSGFVTSTFFNSKIVTVSPTGLTPTSFQATFPYTNSYTITGTQVANNVVTYSYAYAGGTSIRPIAGQLVTITGTVGDAKALNVTNAVVATGDPTGAGTFTVNLTAANEATTPENGSAVIATVPTTIETGSGVGIAIPNTNISSTVGPLQFASLNASVVSIDANGVATAAQPGSTTITADISQASSTAGFFSTCPPASIVLSIPPSTSIPTSTISVNQNTTQPFTATVKDIAGNPITNLNLTYVSTSPTTIPVGGPSTIPVYPSSAAIFAICQPPICNPSPFNEIGLFGNGTPASSNPLQIQATGTDFSTVLYIASKESQFLLPYDFTTTNQVTPVRMPYAPNSMVISLDSSTIYMGTSTEIMVFSTASNSIIKQDTSVSGNVIAISPDSNTIIVTDPVRQLTYLYLSTGGASSQYGGIATRAAFSADSSTVYITTTDGRLLVHSSFTGWSSIPLANVATDAVATIPAAGVYLGGPSIDVRTNCPATSYGSAINTGVLASNPAYNPAGFPQTTTNNFYPDAGTVPVAATRLAATNDGLHIFGATNTSFTDILTNAKSGPCPVTFSNTPGTAQPLTLGAGTGVSNVLVTSDSAYAFVTYQGTAGTAPQYSEATKTVTPIILNKLVGTPADAVAGAISADNNTFYVGTEGDNAVHILTRGTTGFSDTKTPLLPALPNINGTGTAQPDLIVQHPRRSTS